MKIKLSFNGKEYIYSFENKPDYKLIKSKNHKCNLIGKMTADLFNNSFTNLETNVKWRYDNPDFVIIDLVKKYLKLTNEEINRIYFKPIKE
ncbi:MAG: hypothetical protein ACRC4M_01390 [Mycoplasma sp.]